MLIIISNYHFLSPMVQIEAYEFIYASPHINFDLKSNYVTKYMKRYNPSMILHLYRKNKKKQLAVGLLLSRFPKTNRVKEEIVYTYILFGDYVGALDYLKYYEFVNNNMKHLDAMLKLHLLLKTKPQDLDEIFGLVQGCLAVKFVKSVLKTFIEYAKTLYPEDYESKLRRYLACLSDIHTDSVLGEMQYKDIEMLYKIMPSKTKYLKMMVKMNPFIKKIYYFEYAAIFGIQKEDIVNILSNVYREWAFLIALDKLWFVNSMRPVLERQFGKRSVFINYEGKWEHSKNTGIRFLKDDLLGV